MTTASSSQGMIRKPIAVEPGAKTPADRVFVSPRVVDEQAFREFSTELRALIDEVRSTQNELASAGADASSTAKSLAGSQEKYRQHLELTTKLLKALTIKSSEVEKTLEQVDERLERAKGAERSAELALEAKVSAFERSLEDRLARIEASYEGRLKDLEAGFEEKKATLAAEWDRQQTEMRERIESHRVLIQTGISAQADEVEAMLRDRAEELTGGLVGKLEGEREAMEASLAQLEAQRTKFASETGEPLQNTLEQLRTACEIAVRLVGWNPGDVSADPDRPTEGSLGGLVLQASKAREDAEWSVRRLSSIKDQAQTMISELSESLDGSLSLFDQLHAQRTKLDAEIGSILSRAENTGESLRSRQAEIEALVSPLSETLNRAEATTRELCSVADGAADLVTHAGIVHGDLDAVLTTARELTAKLDPWRATILEMAETAELPAPLARIVERFEQEIGRDLSKMASAMQMIAQRAETTFRAPKHAGDSPEIVIRPRGEAAAEVQD